MRIVRINGLEKYDIYMQDFLYEDTRLFVFHNKRDLSNEDHHAIEYGFYKGLFFHSLTLKSDVPYYFNEKNVFGLSENGNNGILFYLCYGDNYNSNDTYKDVSLYRLDCRSKESMCVSKRYFKLDGSETEEDFFRTLSFVGINERYVFISFQLGTQNIKYNYLVDSITGEWTPISSDYYLDNMEKLSVFSSKMSNYIVMKTGQYLFQEKKDRWDNPQNGNVDEHLIVINDKSFIESVMSGNLDYSSYVINTCSKQCAQSGYYFDTNEIVYFTNHFDSSTFSITKYNPITFERKIITFSGLYSSLLRTKNNYYSCIFEDEKQTIYDLEAMRTIATIKNPESLFWIDSICLLTYNYLSNGNMRLSSKNIRTNQVNFLGEGICFVDVERDLIIIFEHEGL